MLIRIPGPLCAVGGRHSEPPSLTRNMKILDVPQTGKIGRTVSYKTRFGQVQRRHVIPRDPRTTIQIKRRKAMSRARFLWGTLTDEQYAAWHATARSARTRRRLGQSGPLTGYLLFIKINCNLAALDLPFVLDPPAVPRFGPNPVGKLTITNTKGVIALKLTVSGQPAQPIVLLGTKPRSPGVSFVDHFTILGRLPDPDQGMSDITDLFVGKYRKPAAGSRVFIQTLQQINGWQDLPQQTSALVPAA